ncbi:MAG: hypothetical protein IPN90_10210 [Elusimicrobia bacterium]|nr:hypothetical protein [Elusimicrobiota bacterium]
MPLSRRSDFWGWVLGSLFLLLGAWFISRKPYPQFPPFERPLMELYAAQDMGMVLNGARRLGADLALIQLMQYYGSAENANPHHPRGRRRKTVEKPHDEDGHEEHVHLHLGSEGTADATNRPFQSFPQLLEYTLRGGSLDPHFHFLFLFGSGALAFNLNRGDEAMTALEFGLRGDPSFWRYRMYQGGIAYRKIRKSKKPSPT